MKYYVCANTSCGYWNFTEDNVSDVGKIINLKCANQYAADKILRIFCESSEENFDEIIKEGSRDIVGGIVSGDRRIGVISNYESAIDSVDFDKPSGANTDYALALTPEVKLLYTKAKQIHDDWEKIYIGNMDFPRLDSYCQNVISSLVNGKSKIGTGTVYKRFFGTTTSGGNVNFIDDITADLKERYFIKGRPGTGKSTFLKKLSSNLLGKGYTIEQYYCSFDPHSLDMVVCREMGVCVFDSTNPHEKFPEREGDIILDFYEESGLCGTDEKFASELLEVKTRYNSLMAEINAGLSEALVSFEEMQKKEFELMDKTIIADAVEQIKEKCN